jgi:hypothetical protein
VIKLFVRFIEYWHRSTSNNAHNYIVLSFLTISIVTGYVALALIVVSWWKGLPPPPKELFVLLEMLLYALGGYAGLNATAHVTKTIAGKPGANTPSPAVPEPKPE